MPKGRLATNHAGLIVGRLTVIERVARPGSPVAFWRCRCACGRETVVAAFRLKHGQTKSCGCIARERASRQLRTHGLSKTPEYFAWAQAKARCRDKNHQAYKHYGARGITMSEEWASDFMAFLRDMGPRPSRQHTLDRKDNDGPYAPGNCRWASWRQQQNNRRGAIPIEFQGQRRTLAEWARLKHIPKTTIYQRVAHGWTIDRVLNTPHKPRRSRSRTT